MQNQEIVLISRSRDGIIVQGRNDVYDDSLENFETDYGSPVPDYINELDRCWDTDHAMLNGKRMTPEDIDAENYAKALLAKAHDLKEAQDARMNPPKPAEPEPTEEELEAQRLQNEINEAEGYLCSTDYRILKFIDRKIKENPELLAEFNEEYPDTLTKREEAREKINATEAQVASLNLSSSEEV